MISRSDPFPAAKPPGDAPQWEKALPAEIRAAGSCRNGNNGARDPQSGMESRVARATRDIFAPAFRHIPAIFFFRRRGPGG